MVEERDWDREAKAEKQALWDSIPGYGFVDKCRGVDFEQRFESWLSDRSHPRAGIFSIIVSEAGCRLQDVLDHGRLSWKSPLNEDELLGASLSAMQYIRNASFNMYEDPIYEEESQYAFTDLILEHFLKSQESKGLDLASDATYEPLGVDCETFWRLKEKLPIQRAQMRFRDIQKELPYAGAGVYAARYFRDLKNTGYGRDYAPQHAEVSRLVDQIPQVMESCIQSAAKYKSRETVEEEIKGYWREIMGDIALPQAPMQAKASNNMTWHI